MAATIEPSAERRARRTERPSHGRARRLAPALAALWLAGCSSAASAPLKTVVGWALGSQHLSPEVSADRYILLLPVKRPVEEAKPAMSGCLRATALLPAPAPDPRVFLLAEGQLYVRRAPDAAPEKLAGNDPAREITRMLAFDKHASPLQMLVTARTVGGQADQIWKLTVEERAIQAAAPVAQDRSLASQEAFFDSYHVARCLDGGQRCLSTSEDSEGGHFLDVEPERGSGARESLLPLGPRADVSDVAWAAADGSSVYLLARCP